MQVTITPGARDILMEIDSVSNYSAVACTKTPTYLLRNYPYPSFLHSSDVILPYCNDNYPSTLWFTTHVPHKLAPTPRTFVPLRATPQYTKTLRNGTPTGYSRGPSEGLWLPTAFARHPLEAHRPPLCTRR